MPELFGLDIAGIINTEIENAGGVRTGTLTKTSPGTRTPGDPTAGTNPATTTHTFNGFVERKEVRLGGQVSAQTQPVVSILGASVSPEAVPEVNDEVVIDGETLTLVELLENDPARALYEFAARGAGAATT